MATVGVLSYLNARRSLQEETGRALTAVAQIKTDYIESYFSRMLTDLRQQAEMVANVRFLTELEAAFEASGKPVGEFVGSFRWEMIVDEHSADLMAFHRVYGYYDVFLIDSQGNLLFTVAREDDLGTNLLDGKYSDTLFASACAKALKTGQPVFSDFEFYAPSENAVAGFLASVLLDDDGEKVGLVAFQASIDQIDGVMQQRAGLGTRGESYLVGADLRMRSNSPLSEEQTILKDPVETEQVQAWVEAHAAPGSPLECEREAPFRYLGYRAAPVLGIHKTIELAGVRMGVIAEIDAGEAFDPVKKLLVGLLIIAGAVLVVIMVVAAALSGRITRPVADTVSLLSTAGSEILAASQEQTSTAQEQAATVQEIGSTMEELTQSGTQISDRAKQVGAAAQASSSASASGLEAVQEAAQAMEAIREQVEEVAENIVSVSERTQAVGEIISTVNEIAEQSNLLALNASIEAASAGQEGSRFSVVANEMKNLADQAKESTVQVRTILEQIQKGINTSVMLTEEAVKRVEAGKEQATASQDTIRELTGSTQESVQAFQQIVGGTGQQQIGVEQAMQGMKDIRQGAEQAIASSSQLERAAGDLNALGERLRLLVES